MHYIDKYIVLYYYDNLCISVDNAILAFMSHDLLNVLRWLYRLLQLNYLINANHNVCIVNVSSKVQT